MKPRCLDLFCGAGGAAMGLDRAGFDVVGVDINPQPRFQFEFVHADALQLRLGWMQEFDFIWASPPCQAFTSLRHLTKKQYPNLIPQTRMLLKMAGAQYCIENVEGAPLGESGWLTYLCGTMFGLGTPDGEAELRRHRLFETSFPICLRPACQHGTGVISIHGDHARDRRRAETLSVTGSGMGRMGGGARKVITVSGDTPNSANTPRSRRAISIAGSTPQTNVVRNRDRKTYSVGDAKAAMGIDWMTMKELSQAIPPAYSEFVGRQAIEQLRRAG